jgi:hypothetical protein
LNQLDILENFSFDDEKLDDAWKNLKYKDLPPMDPPSPGTKPVEPLRFKDKVAKGGGPLPQVDPLTPKGADPAFRNSWKTADASRSGSQGSPAGRIGKPNPGISRGSSPQANAAVQGVRKWAPVDTSGALRTEISAGAVTDTLNGYNRMAISQQLTGLKDGTPVPGVDHTQGFDGAFDFDINNPPPEFAKFGDEMTGAVGSSMDEVIEGASKGDKKLWRALKPEVVKVESGFTKVMSAINSAWGAIWDAICAPFKAFWGAIKDLGTMIGKWFGRVVGHAAKGTGAWGKIARGFTKVFNAVRATRAWKAVTKAASYYYLYVTKVAPMVLKHGVKWVGKALTVVGWATLIFDVMDAMQLADCMSRLNKDGDGPDLPSYCQGAITKTLMSWMGHKMNAAAGAASS